VALRELGRIERTLFILDWLQSVELRRRVNAGLNEEIGQLEAVTAAFKQRLTDALAADDPDTVALAWFATWAQQARGLDTKEVSGV
jgi:hypothetical protein